MGSKVPGYKSPKKKYEDDGKGGKEKLCAQADARVEGVRLGLTT
jgi:hypothetical protein